MNKKRLASLICLFAISMGACALQLEPSKIDDGSGASEVAEVPPSTTFKQSDQAPPHSDLSNVITRSLLSVVNVRVHPDSTDVGSRGGEGSGVIIDPKGIILTNAHVVQSVTDVEVVLSDKEGKPGEKLTGQVVGTSPARDIAVVKVSPDHDLPAIQLGRSGELRLGDEVIAIGFPLDLGGATVTRGIISATNRDIQVDDAATGGSNELRGLLQTDAAINPGNSGGALIDLNGQLVGINTAAAGASFAENIGFAIGIDNALSVVKEIIGAPEQAFLGIVPINVDPLIAEQIGIDADTKGALIDTVLPDTPAEDAGLDQGDVITAIDGDEITNRDDLLAILSEHEPGDKVELTVVDPEGERQVDIELGQRPVKVVDPEG